MGPLRQTLESSLTLFCESALVEDYSSFVSLFELIWAGGKLMPWRCLASPSVTFRAMSCFLCICSGRYSRKQTGLFSLDWVVGLLVSLGSVLMQAIIYHLGEIYCMLLEPRLRQSPCHCCVISAPSSCAIFMYLSAPCHAIVLPWMVIPLPSKDLPQED